TVTKKTKKIQEKKKSVSLGKENNKLVPTDLGIMINKYMCKYFSDIVDYKFTADMEKNLDKISKGKKKWYKVIEEFYKTLKPKLKKMKKKIKKGEFKNMRERELGKDPKTKKKVVAKMGRKGGYVTILED